MGSFFQSLIRPSLHKVPMDSPHRRDVLLQASELADSLNLSEESQERLLYLAMAHLSDGHLSMELSRISGFAQEEGFSKEDAKAIEIAISQASFVGTENSLLIRTESSLRFEKLHQAELTLAESLRQYLKIPEERDRDSSEKFAEEILEELGMDLHERQKEGLIQSLMHSLVIVSGGPGTGKTTVMASILCALKALGMSVEDMALAAPTGRAAQRMSDALREQLSRIPESSQSRFLDLMSLQASTLHRLLGYSASTGVCRYHKNARLPYRLIVLDEVSMVDALMMQRLMEALDPKTTRLLLLGDRDQLPSVEAGAVLASLLAEEGQKVLGSRRVMLSKVFRSQAKVLGLAQSVLKGEVPDLPDLASGAELWEQADEVGLMDPEGLDSVLNDYSEYLYPNEILKRFRMEEEEPESILEILRHFRRGQILSLIREGDFGVYGLNEAMRRRVCYRLHEPAAQMSFAGMPILIQKNHYRLGLFNGDSGVLFQVGDRLMAWFEKEGQAKGFSLLELPDWQPAFAMTVHKSQGSEFSRILMVLPRNPHPLLSRELVYTGITRARQAAYILGEASILKQAVQTRARQTSVGEIWGRVGSELPS